MNNGYKVPNLNEGLDILDTSSFQDDRMLKILQNINKPMNEAVDTESNTPVVCPECGATWTPEVNMKDGSKQICPVCDHVCNPDAADESAAEAEDTIEDPAGLASELNNLEESLTAYVNCITSGEVSSAKAILESAGATAIYESSEGIPSILLEKFVIRVDSSGRKTKVKVRTKKAKLTSAQKSALRKARKNANKGSAKAKRKKAMKARARMGLTESLRKSRTINAVQALAESAGVTLSTKDLEAAINRAYDIHESEIMTSDENMLATLETILRNKGIEILDSESEVVDGVLVAHLEVSDTDAEVYLGDIADEVAESLQGYDVDYDEPEEDEDGVIFIDFYFVPILTSESCSTKRTNEETEEDQDKEQPAVNENLGIFESFAGGADNVRCRLHPGFIKPGQVIFDADENTVFTALTESVACNDDDFSLAVDIQNSSNSELVGLAPGAEVSLSRSGNYFLLKANPTK